MNAVVRMQPQPANIESLIALVDEMILIVAEENSALAKGLPASRSKLLGRKIELAALFEQWAADVSSKKVNISAKDHPQRSTFVERIQLLQVVMDENIIKLRAAIEASQRRIDAVMNAIRERISASTPYAANGRLNRPAVSYSPNMRA
jgi:hypothetical protein